MYIIIKGLFPYANGRLLTFYFFDLLIRLSEFNVICKNISSR